LFGFVLLFILSSYAFAEVPEMSIGIIPPNDNNAFNILHYFRGAVFVALIAVCFKALKTYSKLAIAHGVWLLSTAILSIFAHNTNHSVGIPDFSYFSVALFLIAGIYIYASAEYLRRNLLNHNKSGLFDNMIHVIAGLLIAVIAIIGIKNPTIAADIMLYSWAAVIIIGTITAIYYIVDKSVDADLVLLGWIPAQIGFVVVMGISTTGSVIAVITAITAWSSVIIAHIFLAGLTFLRFQNAGRKTMLHTQPNTLSLDDSVTLIVDKAVFRIKNDKQKVILNEACAKMLHISGRKAEFSIEAFKGLVAYEYQSVIDKIIYEKINAPEIIKFHVCNQKGFIQPLQLRNDNHNTHDDDADILFLYQEITSMMPVTQNTSKTDALLNDYRGEYAQSTDIIFENERRKTSDVMYFINKAVSEILKNTQTTGDYVLLLLQIRHYDDWQVILGVSQTHQLIREVTQTLEKALSAFENLVVKNFNGDMIGIFCHILTTDTEIERLKLIIIKQFEAPINVGYYNIFVNFHQGITKIPVGDSDIDMSQDALINLVTNMIDSSKRLISMHHEHSKIDVRDLSLPQDSNIIQLSTDLRYAPERGQINAYYAPIVDLRKGVTVGFNISPVWRHPDFGIIAGDLLHYLSERCQMENTINRLVIAKSIEGMVKLYRSQKMPIMNFAISRNLVLGARIDEEIKNLCDILKISPSLFRLEFSADCLGDNPKWLGNILTDLKSIGVTTVLNGFGSAKGQLASLANLAFDRVIIDSGFADNIIHNERKFFALKSVTTMLKNMSIKADIKDVSSTESFKLLFNAGISNISGSAIGEPMPVERAVNLLTNHAQVN
jgi:EAL domain-containing protein (putative c-di-GMP-specific phosphodiesterase class I)